MIEEESSERMFRIILLSNQKRISLQAVFLLTNLLYEEWTIYELCYDSFNDYRRRCGNYYFPLYFNQPPRYHHLENIPEIPLWISFDALVYTLK
jgi:hypothetical protein